MAFYIHAAHYQPTLFIKITPARFLDTQSEVGQIALYLLTVGIVIALLIAFAHLMQRWLPGVFKLLSGGRTRPEAATRGGFLTA